jgi:YHS domain-containing protein
MGLDPVCKSEVNPMSAEAQAEYDGVVFYFCSQTCKEQFEREPLRYLDDVDLAEMRAKQAAERAA